MCDYCQREIRLNNQIYRLSQQLYAVTDDGGANNRITVDALAQANIELTQLEATAVADPAACDLWHASCAN